MLLFVCLFVCLFVPVRKPGKLYALIGSWSAHLDRSLRVPVLSRFAPRSKLETLASTANTWYRSFQNENLIFMFGPRSLAFSGMTSV